MERTEPGALPSFTEQFLNYCPFTEPLNVLPSQSSFNSIASHCQILSLQLQVDSVQVIVCKHFHFQNCETASINFSQTFLTLTLNDLGLSKKIEIAVDL